MDRGDSELAAELKAFIALCDVVDMIQAIAHGIIQPKDLQETIDRFLHLCVEVGWDEYFIKKFHWLLHMPDHLRRFGFIPWCFTLERKHRLVKRFARSTIKAMQLSRSTYRDVINHELAKLRDPDVFRRVFS